MKLSSESDKRAMQVELANSRREAAAAAAQLKHALANWQVGVKGNQGFWCMQKGSLPTPVVASCMAASSAAGWMLPLVCLPH